MSLTLCLIARDEAALLPGCLASVRGVADAVVVVDTGSTDETAAVAAAAGAQVLHAPWTDDFAAARNVGLEAVSTDWMLVLDADERLAAGAAAALRAALDRGGFDVGLLPVHNAARVDATEEAVLSGHSRLGEPTLLARVFHVAQDLRWVGALHERVVSTTGRPLSEETVGAALLHLGYAPEIMVSKGKHSRNLRILRQMTATDPSDLVAWSYRARDALRAGERDEARAAADAAWAQVQATGAVPPVVVVLVAVRVDLLLGSGDAEAALTTLAAARDLGLSHPNLDLLEASVQLAQGARTRAGAQRRALRAAAAAALRARSAHGRLQQAEVSAGATSWMAAVRLGEALLGLGRSVDAAQAFEAALLEAPSQPGGLRDQAVVAARTGLAELLVATEPGKAVAALEPLLGTPWPDPWAVAVLACKRLGKREDAAVFAQQARSRLAAGWIALHRSHFLR